MMYFARPAPPSPVPVQRPVQRAAVGELPVTPAVGLGLLGLAVVLGGVAWCMTRPARRYAANRSSRVKLPSTCRSGPPKHYPKDRRKYALPECWMYPLHDRPHVRKAAQRFGKHKMRYSPAIRKKIGAAIDRAKRKWGIGEYRR